MTYVVYRAGEPDHYEGGVLVPGSGDTRSAVRIANRIGASLRPLSEAEQEPGYVVGEDLLPDEDLILLGGGDANPFAIYYFPYIDMVYTCETHAPYVIESMTRVNGTTVVIIAGCLESDTWAATKEYLGFDVMSWLPLIALAGVAVAGVIYYGKKRS